MLLRSLLLLIFLQVTLALNCTQIPESQIKKGSTFYLPGPDRHLQPIPANWICTYTIHAPTTLTSGFYAHVTLLNGLKGANDYMEIIEMTGFSYHINSRDFKTYDFDIIPGAKMTIKVITKSVLMNSMFSITVDYNTAVIGGTVPMKTNGEINFLSASTMASTSSNVVTTTYSANEPILTLLATDYSKLHSYTDSIFFVDGNITNQVKVFRLIDVAESEATTQTNFTTIVSYGAVPAQLVFNLASDAKLFNNDLLAQSVESTTKTFYTNGQEQEATEFVNFRANGIIMDDLKFHSTIGKVIVISGPPNNSSHPILSLSTNTTMPQRFDLRYFTVVSDHCDVSFSLKSF